MNKIFQKINPNSKIILAVSGGADSMYLLHQCLNLPSKPKIIVAHLNHKTRLLGSDLHANFVKKIAKNLNLKYEEESVDIKKIKGNLEQNGRISRYQFLEKIRKKHDADWILTAHHLNDQIETLLFNLSRGSHSTGIRGIQSISKRKKILRPLINIEKKEILTYLKKHQLKFKNDSTNLNIKFSRNLIRHKIIPLFLKLNPNFLKTFSESISYLKASRDFTLDQAKIWIKKNVKKNDQSLNFKLKDFLIKPNIIQKSIIFLLYKKIHNKSITTHQLKEILRLLKAEKSNRWKEFGVNMKIMIRKDSKTQKREVVIKS